MRLGASYLGDGRCEFRVWAPGAVRLELRLLEPRDQYLPLRRGEREGYWELVAEDVPPGARYLFRLDGGRERADPASRHQPEGVHGPSAVVDHSAFRWSEDGWRGLPLEEYVMLRAACRRPSRRRARSTRSSPGWMSCAELGVTAIELMPVAQFPGARGWGYDGVFPFAVQNSYGGPAGLKRLVDACHRRGLAVGAGRGLQPPRAGGQLPAASSARYFTGQLPHALGRGGQLRRRPAATRCAIISSRTPSSGCASITSTPCGWTRSTASMTCSAVPFLQELAGRRATSSRPRMAARAS